MKTAYPLGHESMEQQDTWYYADGEQATGPIKLATLQQLVRAGSVKPDQLVWAPHMADWQPARSVSEIAVPPTPPKIPTARAPQDPMSTQPASATARPPEQTTGRPTATPSAQPSEEATRPSQQTTARPVREATVRPSEEGPAHQAAAQNTGSDSLAGRANPETTTTSQTPESSDLDGPVGVGGWLRFLTIGLMFLGPLLRLGGLASEIAGLEEALPEIRGMDDWESYKAIAWVMVLGFSALGFFAGWELNSKRQRDIVARAQVIIWVIGPGAVLLDLIVASAIFGDIMDPSLIGQFLGSCVAAGAWHAYLARSRRVKNTYIE